MHVLPPAGVKSSGIGTELSFALDPVKPSMRAFADRSPPEILTQTSGDSMVTVGEGLSPADLAVPPGDGKDHFPPFSPEISNWISA